MAQMAQPWRHPKTGAYYLRRQIPENLRPAFGMRAVHKQSLRTKDFVRAAQLFIAVNAEFEQQLETARQRLAATGDPRPCQREQAEHLIRAYFEGGAPDGGLDGHERLRLAFQEVDRGIFAAEPQACLSGPALSSPDRWWELSINAALFRSHEAKLRENGVGLPWSKQGKWRASDPIAQQDVRLAQADRVVEQIARYANLRRADLPDGIGEAVVSYLDEARLEEEGSARKPVGAVSRLKPDMRLGELFNLWNEGMNPRPQTASEYRRAIDGFIDYIGDIAAMEVTEDDLHNWLDALVKMPARLPAADRALTFTARLTKYGNVEGGKISATTAKKQLGALQAILGFGKRKRLIVRDVSKGIAVDGYTKTKGKGRRTFLDSEIAALFTAPLFLNPADWRIAGAAVSDSTMFWLLLIGLTSGARLEEIGQAAIADVRRDDYVTYIDIDDYDSDADEESDNKSVKTDGSRRLVPIHDMVIACGFHVYIEALRYAGHKELFPDLSANIFGKRTQAASQRINRLVDRQVSGDRRLVYHSFRHTFKNRGRTAAVQEMVLNQLCGHAATTVGGKYGEGQPLWVLYRELHKLDFSCVDWPSIKTALADFNWDGVVQQLPAPRREAA
ncbi:site-specific integrase [Sphingobium sp. SJ10-10]|uniref:site-specific integrase n=1 Tax=Sphingobium sp. SJ10-10 TaxID=3114999 RepID=UPI002E17196B|nr:site-specific integrase [Sphingobium sp. SJ10-10]